MDITLIEYAIIFVLIGFAGFVDSIAGGGGLITIPTYIAVGVPPELILGTNKAVSTTGTTIAVSRYIKEKLISWRIMGPAIVASMVGSFFGAQLSVYLSKSMMIIILLLVIPVIFLLQRKIDLKGKGESGLQAGFSTGLKGAAIGLTIGGYDGLFGPGTGTFLLIAFVMLMHMNYQQASANGRIINYISNLSALAFFLAEGRVFWPVAGVAFVAAMLGNYIGSGMVLTKAEKIVGPVFRLVLLGLILKCVFDLYKMNFVG